MAANVSSEEIASASEVEALKATTFRRLHPRLYLERFLTEGVRPDGRAEADFRDVAVNVGSITNADGSALVRLGDTTVVCGVKAEIAEPELDRPNDGYLVSNIDLPAICSPKFKPGPPSDEAQDLSDRLHEALVGASVVSTSTLVIESGKAAWVLYVDVTCVNYDGNVFDAALIAMVAALRNTKLPKATYNEDDNRTTCTRKVQIPLQMSNFPIPSSWGIFNSKHVLADPTTFEESLLESNITVIMNQSGRLLSVAHVGDPLLFDSTMLSDCTKVAESRARTLASQLYAL